MMKVPFDQETGVAPRCLPLHLNICQRRPEPSLRGLFSFLGTLLSVVGPLPTFFDFPLFFFFSQPFSLPNRRALPPPHVTLAALAALGLTPSKA